MPVSPLPSEALYRRCSEDLFGFSTTQDLEGLNGLFGQDRALEAIRFGTQIDQPGYNMFVLGPDKMGKTEAVRLFLNETAKSEPKPSDWVYVANFEDTNAPSALRLPPGLGQRFKHDVAAFVTKAKSGLPAIFDSDEYLQRRQAIERVFERKHTEALNELKAAAEKEGLALINTEQGIGVAPVKDGDLMKPEDFAALERDEQKRIERTIRDIQQSIEQIFREVPKWEAERVESIENLIRDTAGSVVDGFMSDLKAGYKDLPEVAAWIEALALDIVNEVHNFASAALRSEGGGEQMPMDQARARGGGRDPYAWQEPYQRYQVNLIVDHSKTLGAPVVLLDFPSFGNVMGRLEHRTHLGAMVTDHTLIKAGGLHQANGGYALINAMEILQEPAAWDALKRALERRSLRIESLADHYSLVYTVSVEPEPIPLDVKVILFGPAWLYHWLCAREPDFLTLFKVQVEFTDRIERDDNDAMHYARLIGSLARKNGLKPLDRGGVARIIEHSSRMARDAERLSIMLEPLSDIIREADYFAQRDGYPHITRHHVQTAIEAARARADRARERTIETIDRDIVMIDTDGEVVGQINALVVHSLPNFSFGRPSRVTARVRAGAGGINNIDRVIGFGRSIYSKGVEILSAYFLAKFTKERTLTFSATIVHEQSYGPIDGDSASSTELYVLMSALAGVPIRQGVAVTGSVNQFGEVQAIGGVNEKIEGFFDVCSARGLTGQQGVLIPKINQKDLMLRQEVVDAAKAGQFHIYSISTIEEGIEILTGIPAGEADEDGNYPDDSIFGRVAKRLQDFAAPRNGSSNGNGNGTGQGGESESTSKSTKEQAAPPKPWWHFWS